MPIVITKAEVKRKCRIPSSDSTWDSDIEALIAEMQPSLEYGIADVYLNNTGDSRLQAVLKLGILEIISGEFIRQLMREVGASEEFKIAGLTVSARADHGAKLIEQGQARLKAFRKAQEEHSDSTQIASTTEYATRAFTDENMGNW